jgi:hypothetical protein
MPRSSWENPSNAACFLGGLNTAEGLLIAIGITADGMKWTHSSPNYQLISIPVLPIGKKVMGIANQTESDKLGRHRTLPRAGIDPAPSV